VEKTGDTMTGPLVLPGDPVSANQAADKNYVDENVAAVESGLGQKVSTLPSATQTVAQPAGTQLDVNNLNDVEYASQYVNGFGSNGIANATSSPDCAGGCQVKAEQHYAPESYKTASLNNRTHITDARGGQQTDSYFNPIDTISHLGSVAQTVEDVSTQDVASIAQQAGTEVPGAIGLEVSQVGLAGGSNLFPEQVQSTFPYFKMGYSALKVDGIYNTQGQHVLAPETTHCYGVGDCLIGSQFLYASGGFRDSADEGAHPFDLQIHEDSQVFEGTCSSGCSTGSTSITVAPTADGGTQGDGRFLIDTNPAKTITSAGTGGAIISGNNNAPHAFAQFSGTSFPVSVFLSAGQAIPGQATNLAPGTVTFPIATSGVPAGYATNTAAIGPSTGLACVVDRTHSFDPNNYEMAPYTVVDGSHLQMTLKKPHQTLATIAIGGLCGYGLEQTIDTTGNIRQVFPVVGSTSATGLYYAGGTTPEVGVMNQPSGYLNVNSAIASAVRSGNVVTVTTVGNLAANINGLTATIAGVADSSYNGSFAVTTTGTNSFTYAQTGTNSSTSGGTVSTITGGFALYPMAEVLSVFNQTTKLVDGQMTLAPNNVAWAASDTVEEPHFYQERVSPDTEYVGQFLPRPSVELRAGIQYQQNNGPGLTGWSIVNASPTTNYLGYGGTHSFPTAAYEATGVWQRTMILTAGEQAAFTIHCKLHGCGNWNSTYNLFELDSSVGGDVIQYSPSSSSMSITMRGTGYSFTPSGFNAGTINATTLHGALDAANITTGTVAAARLPLFGASGSAHAAGVVPDPGATSGSSRFLREDGAWAAPSGGGAVSSVNGLTGAVTITPQSIGAEPNTAIVPGASADYTFADGSGSTLHDQSGSGNDATLASGAQAPAWLGTGLQFSSANRSGVSLPAALNGSRTIILAAYVSPFGTFGPANSIIYPYPAMLTSTMTPNLGLNLMIVAPVGPGGNFVTGSFGPSTWTGGAATGCNVILSGFHVFAYILGSSPTKDRVFIDGVECPYSYQGSSAGAQTTGNLYLGSSNVGLWASNGFDGNIYRAIFYPSALTAGQTQAMSGLIANQAAQRGVATAPVNAQLNAPQLHCIGDSITWGQGASTNWCSNLTLTRQPSYTIHNWGVPSALLQDETGSEPNRVGQQCTTTQGPSVAIVFSGTNDFLNIAVTPQQVVSNYMGEVQTLKKSGCQVFVATMLSRYYGGVNYDPDKNTFDQQLLAQARAMGADGVVDFAADPNLGADGAYASTTWFADQTHPTTAGQVRLGQIASNALNYYFGYTAAQPDLVAANTYTLASGDAFVSAAPTANAAYTMPDCTGPSGGTYTISNPQSAFTLTIQGGASQPINGLSSAIAIPANSTVKLIDVPNPKSASGCHWVM
jgi:lysophospholipase L1-like esterase